MLDKKVFKFWSLNVLYLCDILMGKHFWLPFKITWALWCLRPQVFLEQIDYSGVQYQLTAFSIGKKVQKKELSLG